MIEQEVVYDADLHFEHDQWDSELSFWSDELKIFKNKLSELVSRWTDRSIMAQLEHFQNQIILHGEVIDILRHDIHEHDSDISAHAVKKEIAQNHELVKKHMDVRSRMETQRQIYTDLKKEFFAFLSQTK